MKGHCEGCGRKLSRWDIFFKRVLSGDTVYLKSRKEQMAFLNLAKRRRIKVLTEKEFGYWRARKLERSNDV